MGVSFLTPIAALFAVLALLPLAVFVDRRRRAEKVRAALRLEPTAGRSWATLGLALAAVPVLVGVAAAQPVITSARTVPQRSDAEVFVVVDTSRSMLASAASGEPTRFDHARDAALELQEELLGVPVGIASFTNVRDRIHASGVAEAGYAQDPTSGATLTAAVNATRGRMVEEGNVGEVAAAVRQALGSGPTVNRRIEGSRRALMPFIALLAAVPLGFVLLRRNL